MKSYSVLPLLLLSSTEFPSCFDFNIPAVLILIFLHYSGVDATSRLKQSGMEFTVWVFKHVSIGQ